MGNCVVSSLPLDLWDGIGAMGPRRLDQLLEGRISRFFQGSNLDVPCSFAAALEQVMQVVELRPEQESKRDILLHRRNIADTPERRIVK